MSLADGTRDRAEETKTNTATSDNKEELTLKTTNEDTPNEESSNKENSDEQLRGEETTAAFASVDGFGGDTGQCADTASVQPTLIPLRLRTSSRNQEHMMRHGTIKTLFRKNNGEQPSPRSSTRWKKKESGRRSREAMWRKGEDASNTSGCTKSKDQADYGAGQWHVETARHLVLTSMKSPAR